MKYYVSELPLLQHREPQNSKKLKTVYWSQATIQHTIHRTKQNTGSLCCNTGHLDYSPPAMGFSRHKISELQTLDTLCLNTDKPPINQTAKTTTDSIAVRETSVSWHDWGPIECHMKPLWPSEHYRIEGFKGALNCSPIWWEKPVAWTADLCFSSLAYKHGPFWNLHPTEKLAPLSIIEAKIKKPSCVSEYSTKGFKIPSFEAPIMMKNWDEWWKIMQFRAWPRYTQGNLFWIC